MRGLSAALPCPGVLHSPRCPSWGVRSHLFSWVFGSPISAARDGTASAAPVLIGMGAYNQGRGKRRARCMGLAYCDPPCHLPANKRATVLLLVSCCPAHGPPASVLSLLASGAAAGQRDAALFPPTVASVDTLSAPALVRVGAIQNAAHSQHTMLVGMQGHLPPRAPSACGFSCIRGSVRS